MKKFKVLFCILSLLLLCFLISCGEITGIEGTSESEAAKAENQDTQVMSEASDTLRQGTENSEQAEENEEQSPDDTAKISALEGTANINTEQPPEMVMTSGDPYGDTDRVLPADNYLALVNREYTVSSKYVPDDLETVAYYAARSAEVYRTMRHEAAQAYNRLAEAAISAGYDIRLTSGYRAYDYQKGLYESYVAKHGKEKADTFSAMPGRSEHQTGLAADLSCASVDWQLTENFADTEEGKWLYENAADYGFIIRYLKGKEDITGYMYEPWHIRYVGVEDAKKIYESGLTLEEYLGIQED